MIDYSSRFSCASFSGGGGFANSMSDSYYGSPLFRDRQSQFTAYRQNNIEKQIARKYAGSIDQIQQAYQGRDFATAMELTEELKDEIDDFIDDYGYDTTATEVINVALASYEIRTDENIKTTITSNTQSIREKTKNDNLWYRELIEDTDEISAEEALAKTEGRKMNSAELKEERLGARDAGTTNGRWLGGAIGAVGGYLAIGCIAHCWNPIGWVGLGVLAAGAVAGLIVGACNGKSAENAKKEEQIARGDLAA